MATKTKLCKKVISDSFNTVGFQFTNGKNLFCHVHDIPEALIPRALCHFISAKVGDSYAGAQTPAEAYEAASEVWDAILRGDWSTARESTGGIIIEALSRLTGKPVEEVKEGWDAMEEAKQKIVAKDPRVNEMVKTIQLERAKAKAATATDALDLGGLFTQSEEEPEAE